MFDSDKKALIALGDKEACIIPKMGNRHGLIAGATGTGKTVTLQTIAETFSQMGVPVFAADVKGDLSGVAAKGGNKESVVKRVEQGKLAARGFAFQSFPVQFWDVFGERGAPVRATIADMGPLLLARLLNLNDTQSSVLTVLFKIAADQQLALVDIKDLQKTLEYVGNNTDQFQSGYGNISAASLGAIQRNLLALSQQGVEAFFGEPALNIDDLLQTEGDKGVINILASDKLMQSPKVYSTFLLWLMSKLFDVLPEVGDMEKPKLVFFFDEAHLLFNDAPKVLLERIEQVVRLIRSKGVGVYFITQNPSDLPDTVLGQLGNRVQHALRAFTPKDQKALKAAAQTFRANSSFDTEKAISELGIGEALVSFLDDKGAPMEVERALIVPPQSQIGPLDEAVRASMLSSSIIGRYYGEAKDRTSAYEILSERLKTELTKKERIVKEKDDEKARIAAEKDAAREKVEKEKAAERALREAEKERKEREKEEKRESKEKQRFWGGMAKSVVAPVARQLLGSLFKKR